MLNVMNKHAPFVQRRIKGRSCPWLNSYIRKKINNRDYHLRKARTTKAEVDWLTYKRLQNRVNRLIDKAKQSYNKKNLLTEMQMTQSVSGKQLNRYFQLKEEMGPQHRKL